MPNREKATSYHRLNTTSILFGLLHGVDNQPKVKKKKKKHKSYLQEWKKSATFELVSKVIFVSGGDRVRL